MFYKNFIKPWKSSHLIKSLLIITPADFGKPAAPVNLTVNTRDTTVVVNTGCALDDASLGQDSWCQVYDAPDSLDQIIIVAGKSLGGGPAGTQSAKPYQYAESEDVLAHLGFALGASYAGPLGQQLGEEMSYFIAPNMAMAGFN